MHKCKTHREGDWVVFTCDKCPGYERRINLKTRKMRVSSPEDVQALHTGSFARHDLGHAFEHTN